MSPPRRPHRHEAAPDAPAPPARALQLQQIQRLQRRRKSLAQIELAAARRRVRECEAHLQAAAEALAASRQWTASRRAELARELAESERSTQDLLRWRQGDRQLLDAAQDCRRAWEQARADLAQAGEEVARRLLRQRRLEAVEEKYSVLLQELLEQSRVPA